MRFSVWIPASYPWTDIVALAQHCEASGWDGVCFADHFMPNTPDDEPSDGDTFECWSILAGLAAVVPRMRLTPLVTSVTYRHPAVLAKTATAVDHISGGRLTLGVGAGWQVNEHRSYGIELGSVKERLDRFEEACTVLRSMLDQPRTTFDGAHFRLRDAPNRPAPLQERVPLLIGGAGERRTMAIAARLADEWNAWTTPEVLEHKVGVLHRHCEAHGRDPSSISVSTQALLFMADDEATLAPHRGGGPRPMIVGTPGEVAEIVARYRDAGADELIVPVFNLGERAAAQDTLDRFMAEVATAFG